MTYTLGKQINPSQTTGGGYTLGGTIATAKPDLTTAEGLATYARGLGLDAQVNQILDSNVPKLSFLQRLGKGLGAFNPAEAILTGTEQGAGAGALKYGQGIIQGIGSAVTGQDLEGERRTFSAIAEKYGVTNGIAKFGIGFLGDVLLDPTTYFGGAIAKGFGITAKGAGRVALKGVSKVAPETARALEVGAEGISDAFGSLFRAGYKTQEGVVGDIMSFFGKKSKAVKGLAESNLARLGTGVLTDEQNAEVFARLVGGKRLEFLLRQEGKTAVEAGEQAIKQSLEGATGIIKETIQNQGARVAKFGEEIIGDEFYRSYFPFIRKDKLNKFIYETRELRVGSEPYLKQFKNLLTNENMETNVAKAFWTRESQVVSDRMTRDFLGDFTQKYGKELGAFKNAEEARNAGFELLREKGVWGKEIGYIPKWDMKFITDMFSPEFKSIDMLAKATGFDAVTSLFKRSVTGLFASFHIRNWVSGNIQNFEVLGKDALNPMNIASGQKFAYNIAKGIVPKGTVTLAGKAMKVEDIFKPFADRYANASFYMNEFDNAVKTGATLENYAKIFSSQSAKNTLKTAGLGASAIPFRVGRVVGNFIETSQKATAYITALGQGKSIQEALTIAQKAGFDYRMVTKFESQIMRRLIPFYSFTRFNIELQLKTLGENPQRINQVIKLMENTGALTGGAKATAEERQGLPGYIQETFGIKLPDTAQGLKQYITSFGTPIEQFAQLFGANKVLRALSMTNPIIKVPIEIGIGKESYRQKDLKDVYSASEYSNAPKVLKDLLMIKEVQKPIYTKNASGKLVKTGERTDYVADPKRLLIARSLFTSRGVSYLDQVFGGDLQGFVKFLKLTTGLKPQQLDLEVTKALKDKDQRRALEDLLIKTGAIRRYENVYTPK